MEIELVTSAHCESAEPEHLILGVSDKQELDLKAIGQRLRTLREKTGKNQEQVAMAMGLAGSTISRWERGITAPQAEQLALVADYYKVSVDRILYGTDGQSGQDSPILREFLSTSLGKTAQKRGWAPLLRVMNPPAGLEMSTYRHAVYGLMDLEGEARKG